LVRCEDQEEPTSLAGICPIDAHQRLVSSAVPIEVAEQLERRIVILKTLAWCCGFVGEVREAKG
jgi:hypothetical protein